MIKYKTADHEAENVDHCDHFGQQYRSITFSPSHKTRSIRDHWYILTSEKTGTILRTLYNFMKRSPLGNNNNKQRHDLYFKTIHVMSSQIMICKLSLFMDCQYPNVFNQWADLLWLPVITSISCWQLRTVANTRPINWKQTKEVQLICSWKSSFIVLRSCHRFCLQICHCTIVVYNFYYSEKYCKSIPQSINGDLEIIIDRALYILYVRTKKVKTKPIDGWGYNSSLSRFH